MKLQFITALTILIASLTAVGGESVTINLWPDGNPNNNGNPNDQTAEMTVFTPEDGKDTGIAVAILPGGAYAGLAMGYEGLDIAEWFAKNGITAACGTIQTSEWKSGHTGIGRPAGNPNSKKKRC